MSKCIFPGTFDPFTFGHLDIAKRAADTFGQVVIAVGESSGKGTMFPLERRVELAKMALKSDDRISVLPFCGLFVDFLKSQKANIVVRGLRTVSDLEYETSIAKVYKIQYPNVESVFLLHDSRYQHIHSSIVRDILRHEGDIKDFVPLIICDELQR